MIKVDIDEHTKKVRQYNKATELMMELELKLKHLPYDGTFTVRASWYKMPISLTLIGDFSPEYTCGLMAEIEEILNLNTEAIMSVSSYNKRVEYSFTYKDYACYLLSFPKNSCQWVEVKKEEAFTSTEHTLVCV